MGPRTPPLRPADAVMVADAVSGTSLDSLGGRGAGEWMDSQRHAVYMF